MLKQLLQAIIDRIKPCEHEWILLDKVKKTDMYYERVLNSYYTWTYRCKKCCESKTISNK